MKKIIIIIFAFVSFQIYAQQDAQYTQYMYNTVSVTLHMQVVEGL